MRQNSGRGSRKKTIILSRLLLLIILLTVVVWFGSAPYDLSFNVVVLHSGDGQGYRDVLNDYKQSVLMNVSVAAVNADSEEIRLNGADMVYLDCSMLECPDPGKVKSQLEKYVKRGGGLFLENEFYNWLPGDMIGASDFTKIDGLPETISFPEVPYNMQGISSLISDYYTLCKNFSDYGRIRNSDHGYSPQKVTATILAGTEEQPLYIINRYGKGYVFLTNPLLPSYMYITGADMAARGAGEEYFNNTAAAANRMLRSEFGAFICKEKRGFALKRVYGPYGRPAMAWQNHIEAIPAFENGSIQIFTQMALESGEIPTFSLVRNPFYWFQRWESVAYLLNTGTAETCAYSTYPAENVYADGKHVAEGDAFLKLAMDPVETGYFVDESAFLERAVPCIADLNGDGFPDMICGSSDGRFYYYEATAAFPDWITRAAVVLTDVSGIPLSAGAFSSPVLYDVDGDGLPDIVSGSQNGAILWFRNMGGLDFLPMGTLLDTSGLTYTAPEFADVNGDGRQELIVGSGSGKIVIYDLAQSAGDQMSFIINSVIDPGVGEFTVPRAADLNGNGRLDLAVGTADGYIAKLISNGSGFDNDGYFECERANIRGNRRLMFGRNASPAFYDIDGDGKPDMIVGRLEYGMAVPVDSPYFPFRRQLDESLEFLRQNSLPVMVHNFANPYQEAAAIQDEIALQKQAFEALGLDLTDLWVNQHTWYLSYDPVVNFCAQHDAGVLWNSGWIAGNADYYPQTAAENVFILPFFLNINGEQSDMLIFNTGILLEGNPELASLSGKWDVPVSQYYHCDYDAFRDPEACSSMIGKLDSYRNQYDYNFMTEQQMAESFTAAMDTRVSARLSFRDALYNMIRSLVRPPRLPDISLSAEHSGIDSPLLDSPYSAALGVKLEAGEMLRDQPLYVDADIYARRGNDYYIGFSGDVTVTHIPPANVNSHILRLNMPAQIERIDNKLEILFLDDGLMQAKLYAPDGLRSVTDGFTIADNGGGTYTITGAGSARTLEIILS